MSLDRRAILNATAFAALVPVASSASPRDRRVDDGPDIPIAVESVPDRRGLSAIAAPRAGHVVYLAEPGRSGMFRCVAGRNPTATDPLQGLSIPSSAPGFFYERIWDGSHGRPEWFGARPGDPDFDCADAIEACYRLCPVTELGEVDYFVRRTLRFSTGGRTFRGVGRYATGPGGATRIVLHRAAPGIHSDDIMVVGLADRPSHPDDSLPDNHFSNFTLIRDGACTPPPSGDIGSYPTGLRARFVYHSSFRDIASLESSVGFAIGGVVYTKFDDCLSQRTRPGTTGRGDRMVGYFFDGRVALGYSGGNASVYMNRCLAMDQHPGHVDPTGLLAIGAFVDSFLDRFESARIATGMSFQVDGARADYQTIDLHIRNPVLDGCGRYGIDLNLDATSSCSIEIFDPYITAAGGGGEHGIFVHDGAGLVTITGGQIHGAFGNGSVFLSRTRGVRLAGTKIHQSLCPVIVDEASGLLLEPQINNYQKTAPGFAMVCRALSRSMVRPIVIGATGPAFQGGIDLDARCAFSEFDGTGIDPGCFVVTDARFKIHFAGSDVRGSPANARFLAAGNTLAGVRD
jgi:hypothetical protein